MLRSIALLCLAALSCASQPASPFLGDERFLRFGVDPNQEANAVIQDQRTRGYSVSRKIVGQYFSALGFMEPNGRSAAVRIVTARGIAVALDPTPATPLESETTFALIAPPLDDTHDPDRDGFDEVFVERRTAAKSCIEVYRIRDVGFVDPVKLDTHHFGQDFCPYAVVDLDDDGAVELLADVPLRGFEPLAPHVRVALWPQDHRFEANGRSAGAKAFMKSERLERDRQLTAARNRGDVSEAMRLGIELAALLQLWGGRPDQQAAEVDMAVQGLALKPGEAATSIAARNRIRDDWNVPTPPTSPSGTRAGKEAPRP
jgi:hypothetical protein